MNDYFGRQHYEHPVYLVPTIPALQKPSIRDIIRRLDAMVFSRAVEAILGPENERKIAAALGVIENSIDLLALKQRLASTHSTRVTPCCAGTAE